MSAKHLYLVAVAAILGCAAASSTSDTSGISTPRKGNLLTAEEIATNNADVSTAYDAIARLRPNWLATHGPSSFSTSGGAGQATVFVDGTQYGDLNSLRNIQAYHVAEIRYYDVTEAGAKYGLQGGTSGVIEVKTKVR
jgi:hypothetical protein